MTDTSIERSALEQALDVQRGEISGLLSDITDDDARRRLVPSLTTVLGLVKHAEFVERVWFHARVAGIDRDELGLPRTVDESFVLEADDTVASIRDRFEEACERSREIAAEHSLDEEFTWHGRQVSLRFVHTHLAAEYARHAGHGDILREQLAAGAAPTLGPAPGD